MGVTPLTARQKNRGRSTDVWLTPQPILLDLGPFDLDPCAAPLPRPWPTATLHMVESDDGLATPWPADAFVWMNPPYSNAGKWLAKLADHGSGIALVFARTETKSFFEAVWSKADCFFFVKGRIRFCRPDGLPVRKGVGASVLVGYGPEAVRRLARTKLQGQFLTPWRTI